MATPSYATRPRPAQDGSARPAGSEAASPSSPSAAVPMARIVARIRTILADRSDSRLAQLIAGEVFLLRVANAMIALGSQVLLARWMGRFEFGVYIYVWTWVLMIGSLSDVGLSTAARRFIPEYTELGDNERLRGFLTGGRWLALGVATAIAVVGAIGVTVLDRGSIISRSSRCTLPASLSRSPASARCRPASRNPTTGRCWRGAVFHRTSGAAHRRGGRGLVPRLRGQRDRWR